MYVLQSAQGSLSSWTESDQGTASLLLVPFQHHYDVGSDQEHGISEAFNVDGRQQCKQSISALEAILHGLAEVKPPPQICLASVCTPPHFPSRRNTPGDSPRASTHAAPDKPIQTRNQRRIRVSISP